jgi:hypothetical protein
MLGWILGKFRKPVDLFEELPDGCSYDPSTGTIKIEYRGVKGYFSKDLMLEMRKHGIDYIDDFKKAVDEVMEQPDEDDII